MSSTPYFSSVTSVSAFNTRFKSEHKKHFVHLKYKPASDWGREHLFACRVVRHDSKDGVLPVLSPHVEKDDLKSPGEISQFLDGPSPELWNQSEHYIVRNSNCVTSLAQVWAALAMFKGEKCRNTLEIPPPQKQEGSEGDSEDRRTRLPLRQRRQRSYADFVDSSIEIGDSSPTRNPLSDSSRESSSVSSLGYVDPDTHFGSIIAEDDTVRLASCVIRHILYFAEPHNQASKETVVEFRDAETRLAVDTSIPGRQIVATDDGGLCLRRQYAKGCFRLENNHVAILEAKTKFHLFDEGQQPMVSDEAFGQMVCAALVTRLTYQHPNSQPRYAISTLDL